MAKEAPETILIFAANPNDPQLNFARLSLEREVRQIEIGLRNSRKRFEIRQKWAPEPNDLRLALLDYRPSYVHFCGHGTGQNGIMLGGQLVDAEGLAGLFKVFSSHIKCVVLNACYSAIQAESISRHIDYVVGMSKEIGDSAAIEFATAFYQALGADESIEFAFELGRNAIQLAHIPEYLTPRLISRKTHPAQDTPVIQTGSLRRDWDGAPAVSLLYGREAVAELLKSWILNESCRVVLITGMGGIGKTDLATCLGRGGNQSQDTSATLSAGIQAHFDCVMWRSLLNAPLPENLFVDILDFLSDHRRAAKHSPDEQLQEILSCLQDRHCLLILDNVEAVLKPGDPMMRYRPGYESYGTFFEQVAKTTHQSCLLLTSREKPRAIADLEGARKPVRSLALKGLDQTNSQSLFVQIGSFSGTDAHWNQIAKIYDGNPLALELAARHIDQVFGGDLAAFLGTGRPVFADLQELLDWHLDRLSKEETNLIYWLAIEREPVNLAALYNDFVSPVSRESVASTLQSLQRRIPLERVTSLQFALQPVLIEHVMARFVDRIVSAFAATAPELLQYGREGLGGSIRLALDALEFFNSHSLMKASAKESIRDSQKRLILGAVAERLQSRHSRYLGELLVSLLKAWREQKAGEPGYAAANIIHLLKHFNIDLHGLNFSHLQIWQACLHDVNLHFTDFSFAEFRQTTFRHAFGTVFSLCYSPSGDLIAIGDDNGDINLFLSVAGQFHLRCTGHSDVVGAVTFSPDGETIASASFDNTIRLWRTRDGQCINILLGHRGWVYCVAFSPDGKKLASASEDGTCRVWDLQSGKWQTAVTNDPSFVSSVAFSPDGKLLAVAGSASVVHLFSLPDLDRPVLLKGHSGRIRSLAFSPQSDMLASGGEDWRVNLWNTEDGALLTTLAGHSGDVMSLSFSDVGDVLASASQDHTVRLWSTVRKECIAHLDVASARVWTLACSPTARTVATGSEDGAVRVWDMDTRQCLMTLQGHSNKTWSLAFAHDPLLLISGSEDKVVRVWNTEDAQIKAELRGHNSRIWTVACSPDGKWLASGSDDMMVVLWDLANGTCKHVLRRHSDWIRALAFTPDALLVATAGEDGLIFVWDVVTGKLKAEFQLRMARIFAITFCNQGRWIAAGGADNLIHLFSASDKVHIGELSGHEGWLTEIITLDASTIASCSEDGTIRIWDLQRRECSRVLVYGAKVWCGAACDRGRSVVSGTEDGVLRRWNLKSGVGEAEVRAHQGSIRSLAVNSAETMVATTGDDGAIRLWHLPDLNPLSDSNTLRAPRPYEGMNISAVTGLTQSQKDALLVLGAIAIPSI
jgi:WD40 repeat protein